MQLLLHSKKKNGFDLQQAQRTLKDHFAEAEQMTMYLVHHLPEDITEDFLFIVLPIYKTKWMTQSRNSNKC